MTMTSWVSMVAGRAGLADDTSPDPVSYCGACAGGVKDASGRLARGGAWTPTGTLNFPNHRDAALRVLGVPEDREAVRQAVAKWHALELEEAIIAAKGAGGMVRTMAE